MFWKEKKEKKKNRTPQLWDRIFQFFLETHLLLNSCVVSYHIICATPGFLVGTLDDPQKPELFCVASVTDYCFTWDDLYNTRRSFLSGFSVFSPSHRDRVMKRQTSAACGCLLFCIHILSGFVGACVAYKTCTCCSVFVPGYFVDDSSMYICIYTAVVCVLVSTYSQAKPVFLFSFFSFFQVVACFPRHKLLSEYNSGNAGIQIKTKQKKWVHERTANVASQLLLLLLCSLEHFSIYLSININSTCVLHTCFPEVPGTSLFYNFDVLTLPGNILPIPEKYQKNARNILLIVLSVLLLLCASFTASLIAHRRVWNFGNSI